MPKARSALVSAISGSLKDSLTFRNNPQTGAITMQTRPVPTGAPTAKQTAVREAYARLAWLWKNLSSLDKEPYQIMAEARNLTPWNCWLSFHLPIMRRTPLFYTAYSEGAGTTITDFAIGGQSGTINGPIWELQNHLPCLKFDGVDDAVIFNRPGYYDHYPQLTIFSIIKSTRTDTGRQVIIATKKQGGAISGFMQTLWVPHRQNIYLGDGSTWTYGSSSTPAPVEQVNTIAARINGANSRLYTNGIFTNPNATLGNMVPSDQALKLGRSDINYYPFKGYLYLNAVFPYLMPDAGITALDAYYRPFFT